jgi:hypothetical protein
MKFLRFEKSLNPKKKYDAILEINDSKYKRVSFGSRNYQQFKDSTGLNLYSHLNHLDEKRRRNYYLRHKINYPFPSADYFSKRFLW